MNPLQVCEKILELTNGTDYDVTFTLDIRSKIEAGKTLTTGQENALKKVYSYVINNYGNKQATSVDRDLDRQYAPTKPIEQPATVSQVSQPQPELDNIDLSNMDILATKLRLAEDVYKRQLYYIQYKVKKANITMYMKNESPQITLAQIEARCAIDTQQESMQLAKMDLGIAKLNAYIETYEGR